MGKAIAKNQSTALFHDAMKAKPTALQFYDAAKAALAKAVEVDEIKDIHDKARQINAAAKVAKDKELEANAHEIRERAKRRLGQLIKEQKKTVGLNKGGKSEHRNRVKTKPGKGTLAEAGIDKNLAHQARTAAKPSDEEFEQKVEADKQQIKSPTKPKVVKPVKTLPDLSEACVASVRTIIEDTVAQMRRGGAGEQKIRFLFQSLSDAVRSIENKTLPPKEQSAEERRALNAKLAEEDVR
jgi:hypothetical protein